MTHDELLTEINLLGETSSIQSGLANALRAVVELHKPYNPQPMQPDWFVCKACDCGDPYLNENWPCSTIQAIEKELK